MYLPQGVDASSEHRTRRDTHAAHGPRKLRMGTLMERIGFYFIIIVSFVAALVEGLEAPRATTAKQAGMVQVAEAPVPACTPAASDVHVVASR